MPINECVKPFLMELLHFSHKQKWFTVVQRAVLLVNYEIPSIRYATGINFIYGANDTLIIEQNNAHGT